MLGLSNPSQAINKKIIICGKEFTVSGVIGNLKNNSDYQLFYTNTYYQEYEYDNGELNESPNVFMPYKAISAIGKIDEKPTKMVSVDNIYKSEKYLKLRQITENEISYWDVQIIGITQMLNLIIYIITAITAFIAIIAFAFQKNEIMLSMFYRKKELGYLQLFGFNKRKIQEYLIFERLCNCLLALAISAAFYYILVCIMLLFDINIYISAWKVVSVAVIIVLYNILLTVASSKKILKKDVISLIS